MTFINNCECCGDNLCFCLETCFICRMDYCNKCGRSCEKCEFLICKACSIECDKCKKIYCTKCPSFNCGRCNTKLCEKCIYKCDCCDDVICEDCGYLNGTKILCRYCHYLLRNKGSSILYNNEKMSLCNVYFGDGFSSNSQSSSINEISLDDPIDISEEFNENIVLNTLPIKNKNPFKEEILDDITSDYTPSPTLSTKNPFKKTSVNVISPIFTSKYTFSFTTSNDFTSTQYDNSNDKTFKKPSVNFINKLDRKLIKESTASDPVINPINDSTNESNRNLFNNFTINSTIKLDKDSSNELVNSSNNKSVNELINNSTINDPTNESVNNSINDSTINSINDPTNESVNNSINDPIINSINNSTNKSNNNNSIYEYMYYNPFDSGYETYTPKTTRDYNKIIELLKEQLDEINDY